jgi:uncharacterized RDD family membrane protein YckC
LSDEPPNSTKHPGAQEGGGPFGKHFSARPEGSPYPKAEILPRLLARLTDFILAAIFPLALGDAGHIVAVLFLLFADGMLHGQSPGKKLMGIKVVHLPSGREIDYRESGLRNFPLALAVLLKLLPSVGNTLFLTVGAALVAFEAWQVVSDKLGLRMGDLFAGTQVIDTKVLTAQQVRPVLKVIRSSQSSSGVAQVLLEPPRPPTP